MKQLSLNLHLLVLIELNAKMYSAELYDNYMSIVDATDKKRVKTRITIITTMKSAGIGVDK